MQFNLVYEPSLANKSSSNDFWDSTRLQEGSSLTPVIELL